MAVIETATLELLREYQADHTPHGNRTLYHHLKGTHDLLANWGNPTPVCLAGLFHSIYGTEDFTMRTASLDDRHRIRAAIGVEAEQLAYLFCVTDRSGFFGAIGRRRVLLRDKVHNRIQIITHRCLGQLIEMEVANLMDQAHHAERIAAEVVATVEARIEKARGLLSEPAYAAFREYYASYAASS